MVKSTLPASSFFFGGSHMGGPFVTWLVNMLLRNITPEVAEKALVALLRAADSALKDVAARTPGKVDDTIVAKLEEVVEVIAKALGVP